MEGGGTWTPKGTEGPSDDQKDVSNSGTDESYGVILVKRLVETWNSFCNMDEEPLDTVIDGGEADFAIKVVHRSDFFMSTSGLHCLSQGVPLSGETCFGEEGEQRVTYSAVCADPGSVSP